MNWQRPDVGKSIVPLFSLEGRGGELHKTVNDFPIAKSDPNSADDDRCQLTIISYIKIPSVHQSTAAV